MNALRRRLAELEAEDEEDEEVQEDEVQEEEEP